MQTKTQITEFLSQPAIAFSGVSRDSKKFTNTVYRELKSKGYNILPVNPNTYNINGDKCYQNINSLPENVNAILISTPKSQTTETVKQAIAKNIKNIFIQQTSDTPEAIKLAEENNENLIYKQCIFMAAEPVQGFLKFHKLIATFFGKFPKN